MTEWNEAKNGLEPHLSYAGLNQCCLEFWHDAKDKNTLPDVIWFKVTCPTCGNQMIQWDNRTWRMDWDWKRRQDKLAQLQSADGAVQESA